MIKHLRQLVFEAPQYCLVKSTESAEENIAAAFGVAEIVGYLPSDDKCYMVTSFASDLVSVLCDMGADILSRNDCNEGATGPATQEDIRKMSSTESLKLFWVTAALIDADRIFKDVLEGYAAVLRERHSLEAAA